jgi:hypothetical protein
MKKLLILSIALALTLTACGAAATPTEAPVLQPTAVPPTAEVIVVTVEVPVEVTAQPQPTAVPPTPMPTEPQPTAPAPTEAAPTQEAPAVSAPSTGLVTVDPALAGSYFKDVTYSSPSFSLRCQPTQITFNATANDPAIVAIDFYYRIEDRNGTTISEWKNQGRMPAAGGGNYSLTLLGESIHPDLRKALAWFDFQLIGINKLGQVVGRTEKIMQMITYTIDCL